jgi:hypothetical protein
MSNIHMSLYFNSFIGQKEFANFFFNLLENEGLSPDKIGLYEPLKVNYVKEIAIDMWTKAERGNGRIFGSMMGKKKSHAHSFIMAWNRGQKYIRPCWLSFTIPLKVFNNKNNSFLNIFMSLFEHFNGLYGYITKGLIYHLPLSYIY